MGLDSLSAIANQTYRSASDSSATALQDRLNGGGLGDASDDELLEVCKEFEAYFVEQVMKEVEKTIPKDEEEDASMSQLRDYYKDEMIQTLAKDVCDQQNLGLAQQLYEQMKRNYSV